MTGMWSVLVTAITTATNSSNKLCNIGIHTTGTKDAKTCMTTFLNLGPEHAPIEVHGLKSEAFSKL